MDLTIKKLTDTTFEVISSKEEDIANTLRDKENAIETVDNITRQLTFATKRLNEINAKLAIYAKATDKEQSIDVLAQSENII